MRRCRGRRGLPRCAGDCHGPCRRPALARRARRARDRAGGGLGSPPPGTHRGERVQRGATSAPRMCTPCAARGPHVRARSL
eukprot:scaffold18639_cov57-Phaeocystis_antarctica.AAC.3